jgi:type IV pilus assembly protein PilV
MGAIRRLLDVPPRRQLRMTFTCRACRLPGRLLSPQCGAFLLEALIALLIFALGATAVSSLHARAIRHVNDAHFRGVALHVAHSAIARMKAANAATLHADFDMSGSGAGYQAVVEQAKALPGVSATRLAPEVHVTAGPSADSRKVAVRVLWQIPGDTIVHRYAATTVVGSH